VWACANGISPKKIMETALWFNESIFVEGIHPLEAGLFRRKYRKDRRCGMPLENPLLFNPKYGFESISKHSTIIRMFLRFRRLLNELRDDLTSKQYSDPALTPLTEEENAELQLRVAKG